MKHLLVAIAALAGTQAQALSCLRPDPVNSFLAANESPETYVILRGRVAEAEILIPPVVGKDQSHPVPGWFIGQALTSTGFDQPLETPVTVQVLCAGPWCGSMLPEEDLIIFATLTDGVYEIQAGPCDGAAFQPSPETEALLLSCFQGAACVPADVAD